MTQLNFTHAGHTFRAEVTLTRDLRLDEILECEQVAPSGSIFGVTDTTDLEPTIERELRRRTVELRDARDRMRLANRPALKHFRLDAPIVAVIKCTQQEPTPSVLETASEVAQHPVATPEKEHVMVYNLVGEAKGRAKYKQDGGQSVLHFSNKLFVDGVAPATIEVVGPFVVAAAKAPKMTPEERKAYRLANPKPKKTAEEKLAALKARVEKLQASLEL